MDSPPLRIPVRLHVLGPHSLILSDLCARCPEGPLGCCCSPPRVDWSDVGRIVANGGRDFLLACLADKKLVRADHGLSIQRVRRRSDPRMPRERKCVFHGSTGCTLDHGLRPATCNYFLCDAGYRAADLDDGEPARALHARLREAFERWDALLSEEIATRNPGGPPWDAAFLDWLGARFTELSGAGDDGAASGPEGR